MGRELDARTVCAAARILHSSVLDPSPLPRPAMGCVRVPYLVFFYWERCFHHTPACTRPAQDLNMLCQTHGRERSLAEYEQLLQAAGFVDVRGHVTGTYLDAVLARKPEQHL